MEKTKLDEAPDISHYVFTARETTSHDFKNKNKDLIEETLSELNALYALKIACIRYGADFYNSPRFDAFSIFIKSLEILVSAFHLACHRQVIEAFALIRLALESGASAFHIVKCENTFTRYCNGDYKSTNSISYAKKVVPIIGEIWGELSQTAVHIHPKSHGPFYQHSDDGEGIVGTIDFQLAEKEETPGQDLAVLTAISLVANIVLRLFEETLLEKSPTYEGWLQFPGTHHSYTCPTDSKIKKFHDNFIKIPDMYDVKASSSTPKKEGV